MRLRRLDLARYGKFTGRAIDFGERAAGRPDLHIVYGPNEAGKSTAFAAFLDLLFGIEQRSPYNFLHPYPTMRIGGALELEPEGAPQEFVRIKRPRNSLLDASDQPIAEGVLGAALGGLDRSAYRLMFSLDDETLEAGGESILESKGDLGQLLFSASAGLADLSRTLDDLRGEAEAFYKYRARSGELATLKAELADLKARREAIDTLASHYVHLVEARDRASTQYEEAIAGRGQVQARMEEIQRHLSALPRLAELRKLRADLAPLADLPEPPPGWLEALPQLQRDDIELDTRAAGAAAEIEQLKAELDAIVVDEAVLALAGRIELSPELRARNSAAEKDLPERRSQLREVELAVASLLGQLGRPDEAEPGGLLLGAATVGRLRELIETRSGIDASLEAAGREREEARHRLDEAAAKLTEAGGPTASERKRDAQVAALAATLASIPTSEYVARRRSAERDLRRHREALAAEMSALQPWQGDAHQLAALAVPDPAEMKRWNEAAAKAQKQSERLEEDTARFEADCARHRAALDAIARMTGLAGEREASALRAQRETAWTEHRRRLDAATADAFEAALRRDDHMTAALLRHEKEIARLQQLEEALAIAQAELDGARKRLGAVRDSQARVDAAVAAALGAMTPSLPEGTTLAQLEAWLARRDKALEVRARLREAEQDFDEAERDIAAARAALSAALAAAGGAGHNVDAGLDALLAAAQSVLEGEAELKKLRHAVEERERELQLRERTLAKATEADAAWQAGWTKACASCWLAKDGDPAPGLAAVREILETLGKLGPKLEARASLAERIRKMEADRTAFAAEVAAIAEALGFDPRSEAAPALAHRIAQRLREAQDGQARSADKAKALDAARTRQRVLAQDLAAQEKRKAEMTAFFGVATLAEVAARLQDTTRRADLRRQAEAAARDILDALRLPGMADAEAALETADRAALEAELAALKARFDDEDQRTRDLFSARGKAIDQVEAVGGDNAAARIEEKRRTILLDVEERAMRYLRLRAGIVAAEQALRVYRDKHRSSMMARASAAFRTISRNAYASLTTQLERDGEILIAVAADGGSKVASELSKGTRFQLYLALRVAGYYEFAGARRPVPFIADDIMETFDDFRAEEAFRLFAEMAEVGQVIYLTHHRHLCDIARRIHPEIRVHDLSAA
jgi:uncharacterized protein YhaN